MRTTAILLAILASNPARAVDDVPNPGRGEHPTTHRLHGKYPFAGTEVPAHSVVQYNLDLSDYCDEPRLTEARVRLPKPSKQPKPEPASVLALLDADLAAYRARGVTVLFRAAYFFGGDSPRGDVCRATRKGPRKGQVGDASTREVSVEHAKALGALIARYPDVVAVVQSGLLGKWGEGHYGSHAATAADATAIVAAWRGALGSDMPIAVRRPQLLPGGTDDISSQYAPIWFQNDALLNTRVEEGTWVEEDWKRVDGVPVTNLPNDTAAHPGTWWYDWQTKVAALLAQSGLTLAGEINTKDAPQLDASFARGHFERFGLTFLTEDYDNNLEKLPAVFREELKRRLGYRLHLATPPQIVRDAADADLVHVELALQNTGFDAPTTSWDVEVSIGGTSIAVVVDTRGWTPAHQGGSGVHVVDATLRSPPTGHPETVYLTLHHPHAVGPVNSPAEVQYRVCLARGAATDGSVRGSDCTSDRRNPVGTVD